MWFSVRKATLDVLANGGSFDVCCRYVDYGFSSMTI